jgi:hypothetical protein
MAEKLIVFHSYLCIFSLTDNWTIRYICMDYSPVDNETLVLKVVMYNPHKQLQCEFNISVLLPVPGFVHAKRGTF